MRRYTVVLSPEPDSGWFTVTCPAAPGAMGAGPSRDEALVDIKASVELWLEVAIERGQEALAETAELVTEELARILDDRDELGWDRTVETASITIDVPVPV
ncbi:MAG: type II toxin-antitoxin system HicB family antitoxin [Dehalococcoidia bacterium]